LGHSTQDSPSLVADATTLRIQAEAELFAIHFANWRSAIGSATALGALAGWMFYYLTGDQRLWLWIALHVLAYVTQAICCWRYEKQTPQQLADNASRWLQIWTALTLVTGLISGALIWFLPANSLATQLSAMVLAATIAIGEVSASGHRRLIFAAVTSQALMVSTALIFHASLPLGVLPCLLFSGVVLHFGLQLNRSMVETIEQRLIARQLAHEIETGQQRLLAVQHEQSVLHERQRVMQDMHDGLGSMLTSSLVLLEQGKLSVDGAAAVMRECVDDLRLVVDSLEPTSKDLATLLGMLRYRLQRRIETAGVTLRWHMVDMPALNWLEPSLALDLLRLVQEAISNALSHSGATILELTAKQIDQDIELQIRDNGKGFDAQQLAAVGRGMRIMQSRSSRLGAQLLIHSVVGVGTMISLRLPVERNG
jgi:signal transduction histidine kinase